MKAAILYKAGDVRVEEMPTPVPVENEVLVRMRAIGICGSDMHLFREGRVGPLAAARPMVLGHEGAGEVAAVGPWVSNVKVGERVVIEPGVSCGQCANCRRGEYNLCPDVRYRGIPPVDGLFAEFVVVPAEAVFRLPDQLSFTEGAMIEPWAIGLHAAQEGGVQPGHMVVVLGGGPIGLFALQAAIVRGATTAIVVDVVENRLELARKLGATVVVNATQTGATEAIMNATDGLGADVVLETSGAVALVPQAVACVKRAGMVVLVGNYNEPTAPMDVIRIVRSRLRITGTFRSANQYPAAIALAAAGRVDVKSMVTHTFPLEDVAEALDFTIKRKDITVKTAIVVP